MPKSSMAVVAIITFWLGWPGNTQAHTPLGKSPDATPPFVSGHRLSGIHFLGGSHKTRPRGWPVSSLRDTLRLTSLDELYNEESEDGEGESTEGYGLGATLVFCGMTGDIDWQFALLVSPEVVASPWVRAVLRC